ncbi:MAG: ABC transporter permease [Acidobacteria bacterium]|nr:ABC transporter permease [Acidobacteriota bacterium]
MKPRRLIFRSLNHYRRTNLAVVAGVAVAVAVMTGALVVGRSVRGSLRDLLFERIGNTETVITADRFFGERLAVSFAGEGASCPIIVLEGVLIHEESRMRNPRVNVYGVDERFWKFQGISADPFPDDRAAFVGSALARQLDIETGDGLILQVETQQSVPREWLYGKRQDVGKSMRLSCRQILPADRLGEFALRPGQGEVYSIFVPLERLRKDLNRPSGVNAVLLSALESAGENALRGTLKENLALTDMGLRLRDFPSGNGFYLESSRILLEEPVADAAVRAAGEMKLRASPVFTYMANSIRANGRSIPYSAISAADIGEGALASLQAENPAEERRPDPSIPPIYLTEWAREDLRVSPGDAVEVEYYVWLEAGSMVTRTASFRMAGVVSGAADLDTSLSPEIPGITEAGSMGEWDPPFPLDLGRIRERDERYWDRWRATPKAFVPLAVGQQLWRSRFGGLTSIRFAPAEGAGVSAAREAFRLSLLGGLNPEGSGFRIQSVKESGLAASSGSTDFAEYFVYFSFFLIASAILLSVLFFRLTVEQRVREIGILKVAGFAPAALQRTFFSEGLILSAIGVSFGAIGSLAYGWIMIYGLRTWWVGAVGTNRLTLHVSWGDLLLGTAGVLLISLATVAWTIRGFRRISPRSLLSGAPETVTARSRRSGYAGIAAAAAALAAMLMIAAAAQEAVSQPVGFFLAGFLSLVSVLCALAFLLRRTRSRPITRGGRLAIIRLGIRNARHRPGRSLLCAALIASATFIIVSTEAFRRAPADISLEADSGTGGYPYLAESTLPVVYDLNSADGREALGIRLPRTPDADGLRFVSFRVRPGDDTSCLNLYTPQEPRILGAPASFIRAGRFSFSGSLASAPEVQDNPWLLLDKEFPDGAVAAVADANTIQYILHLSVGRDLAIRAGDGSTVRLRLAAALRDSIFQGGLIISEANFLRIFPGTEGYRFFLIDMAPAGDIAAMQPLKESLGYWGIGIESTRDLLASYHRVENTYLSTFQSLGTLGLALGTLGLAAVLLRNVLERRAELALLRAAGYEKRTLSAIVLSENILLLLWGIGSGIVCALISIAPALYSRGGALPAGMIGMILIPVLFAGIAASLAAVVAVFRSPLLPALRSE